MNMNMNTSCEYIHSVPEQNGHPPKLCEIVAQLKRRQQIKIKITNKNEKNNKSNVKCSQTECERVRQAEWKRERETESQLDSY